MIGGEHDEANRLVRYRRLPKGLWLFAGLCFGACGSRGVLTNTQKPLATVARESQPLIVKGESGTMAVSLDGRSKRRLFPPEYEALDVSSDGRVWALGDADTNLYVMRIEDTRRRRVPELDHRTSAVSISPDGRTLVATRHADYRTPQRTWPESEDDRVYIVDTKTLRVRVVPPRSKHWVTYARFTADGDAVRLERIDSSADILDLNTLVRQVAPKERSGLKPAWSTRSDICAKDGRALRLRGYRGDEGLDVVTRENRTLRLIVIRGRSRGFHDYQSTIDDAFFSQSCAYVVFAFDRRSWVVDVATGTVAILPHAQRANPVPPDWAATLLNAVP